MNKKIFWILLSCFFFGLGVSGFSQTRFQASFSNSGMTISFKIRPEATNITGFSVIEFFVRVPTAAPAFTWGTPVENSVNFPGIGNFTIDPAPPTVPGYRVTHFFYTAPEPITDINKSYTIAQDYEVFTITVDVDPSTLNMELVHSPSDEDPFYLALTNQVGQDLRPTSETTFFYPTTNTSGDPFFLALASAAPVKLSEFNVSKLGNTSASITWTTTFEQNSSHFVIERSFKESSNWAAIGQVKAKGSSSIDTKYSYTDMNVYDGREVSKTFFYRLRQFDLDGAEQIFPVRSLRFSALGDKEISVFPNPAKSGFYVQIPQVLRTDQKIRLNLVNRIGQVVDSREITGALANNYYFEINSASIVSGDYILDIIYDNQKLATKKLMISR